MIAPVMAELGTPMCSQTRKEAAYFTGAEPPVLPSVDSGQHMTNEAGQLSNKGLSGGSGVRSGVCSIKTSAVRYPRAR
jgi:hypothetical protein